MPVVFVWKDANGNFHQGEGNSRDISSKGEFVFSRANPGEGAQIRLDIVLLRIANASRLPCLQVTGTVVRVEPARGEDQQRGFAVSNQRCTLSERARFCQRAKPFVVPNDWPPSGEKGLT